MRSSWIPAVYLLLDGLGRAAVGMGLLMGHAATVIERRTLVELPTPGHSVAALLPVPVTLDEVAG